MSAKISVLRVRCQLLFNIAPIRQDLGSNIISREQREYAIGVSKSPMNNSIFQNRDDFQVRKGIFHLPEDISHLDPQSKRAVTICNLFVNHHHSISDIVRVLDENRKNVVLVLIKQGIIRDRRERQAIPPDITERRKTVVSPSVPLRTPKKY